MFGTSSAGSNRKTRSFRDLQFKRLAVGGAEKIYPRRRAGVSSELPGIGSRSIPQRRRVHVAQGAAVADEGAGKLILAGLLNMHCIQGYAPPIPPLGTVRFRRAAVIAYGADVIGWRGFKLQDVSPPPLVRTPMSSHRLLSVERNRSKIERHGEHPVAYHGGVIGHRAADRRAVACRVVNGEPEIITAVCRDPV